MLERTSACLDTGVRLSLRQKSLFPKSRRLLSSSFWSTNAPDVDHLCPAQLYNPHVSATYDPTTANSTKTAARNSTTTPASSFCPASSADFQDAPFLDFLYPAPTQLFITRLSQWERWSRKSARPNVLRGYSSLTTTKDQDAQLSSHAHKDLLALLDPARPNPIDETSAFLDIERAWNLSSQLASSQQTLKMDAIVWFAQKNTRAADNHAVDLFDSLPDALKSPAVYAAAISSNLRLDRQARAVTLHKTASTLPREGSIASDALMAAAISQSDWPLAISVQTEWETYHGSSLKAHETQSLGSELDKHSLDSLEVLRILRERYAESCQSEDDLFTHDLYRLHKLLMLQYIRNQSSFTNFALPGRNNDELRGRVRRVFEQTYKSGLTSRSLFENALRTLVFVKGCATSPNCSALFVAVYNMYRESRHYCPSVSLLKHVTKFWMVHNIAFAGKGPDRSFIGLDRILKDWTTYHSKPDAKALFHIMDAFARRGHVEGVKQYADMYMSLYPEGARRANHLRPLINVHAFNRKPSLAAKQLHSLKDEYGVDPDLGCWHIVLLAYLQADDLFEAREHFRRMLQSGIKSDSVTYASLLNLYAKRGDTDAVIDLLDSAKSDGVIASTSMLNSMIVALSHNSDFDGASSALEQSIHAVKERMASGSLTVCFNTMLTAYSWKRDLRAVMTTYHRMKKENVPLDARSYGSLMLALCLLRQSPSAHKILKSVMPGNGIRPQAFHYAILTTGYTNQGMHSEAVKLEHEMEQARVRQTASSRAVALKAKAIYEHEITIKKRTISRPLLPLQNAIKDYEQMLDDPRTFGQGYQPSFGRLNSGAAETMDLGHLIYIHGKRMSFEAVQHIFQLFHEKRLSVDGFVPIMNLLTNLMFVHTQAREFAEVDKYWEIIKSRADEIRRSHVPASDLLASAKHDADVSFTRNPETVQITANYRSMLSRPLEYYIQSQAAQSRISKLVPLLTKLLSQGFQFSNRTWNELIVRLCQSHPPRALLAYTLVEKYMMKDWPGWVPQRHGTISRSDKIWIKTQDHKEGLEYIKARYLPPDRIIPQYFTMVHLANALLEVRGLSSVGLGNFLREPDLSMSELKKQVGTILDIREEAPLTLHAVQSMPRVVDNLQGSLLRAQ
ncbi:hypothetical protein AUEXF2481DRAFT_42432 [Aureobasidium subglaciale EXF-2481]|uniref:Pentacotripeptide-repeat region of PRORP domain-containing protein n=1 Tax=Aureobasidium subglaciale (strain EXF-2481) TaxID=1043005 RepID=A0A074YGH7_AURSE|nr:uncharacterized protein AUEXF2481DRAFT_42432 [Aureobasidium subglaciale EXF-2481]KAI5206980.1 hypothetical protein E4T38_03536 [Aureobasidium subglaciale]KAI5225697.1 hypothetical protein E4T40_03311 [Aureobasidium subglaciale]KAI5229160.1 hypothetical protein E4T41_03625 [Aureobasidium subglaciale]KAI5263945.1 hypothetical protein E4T46_03310 [Aureobasidium subglaciale]KEQ93182.1 hypothetical protein AUEXF2481DRAFT_42432 [Aureobasidium subglaciale EXF-2481]